MSASLSYLLYIYIFFLRKKGGKECLYDPQLSAHILEGYKFELSVVWVLTDKQITAAGAEASAPFSCLHVGAIGRCTRLMSNDWVWHVDELVYSKKVWKIWRFKKNKQRKHQLREPTVVETFNQNSELM